MQTTAYVKAPKLLAEKINKGRRDSHNIRIGNSIEELANAWRARQHKAKRKEKAKILDGFVTLTGYYHKVAIHTRRKKPRSEGWRRRPRVYTNEVKAALLGVVTV